MICFICFVVHILQIEENHLNRQNPCNGATENANTHLPPKSPSREVLNSTGQSIATISNIDIDIQEQKHKKAKPPQPKPSSHHANKPPSLNKRREEKEDPVAPQTHPPKQVLGVEKAVKTTADGLISQSSITPKPAGRAKSQKENKTPDVSMDLKEDTMKLLHEAAMQNIPHDEMKAESRRASTVVGDHHSMCVVRDVPVGSSTEESEVQYCKGTSQGYWLGALKSNKNSVSIYSPMLFKTCM